MENQATAADFLGRLTGGDEPSADDWRTAWGGLLDGGWTDCQAAALLALARGQSAAQLVGAVRAARERARPLGLDHPGAIDLCGTGGDGLRTLNVSTAAAFVVAACGVPVAKHGNRSVSSSSGSSDVLERLGVPMPAEAGAALAMLDRHGLVFLHAPDWHPALARLRPIRRELRFRTIFNLVGPLANPALPRKALVGLGGGDAALRRPLLAAAAELGYDRFLLVESDGMDEARLDAPTRIATLAADGSVTETIMPAADFGLPARPVAELAVAGPEESAARIAALLGGAAGADLDVVLANAALALRLAEPGLSLAGAVARAAEAVRTGAAAAKLAALRSHADRGPA